MQAVSTLKMENACLVDALSTRISEVEALRLADPVHACLRQFCTAGVLSAPAWRQVLTCWALMLLLSRLMCDKFLLCLQR